MIDQVIANIITSVLLSRYALYALAFSFVFWLLYVSIMSLYRRKKQLLAGMLFYILLPVGFVVDVVYNWTVGNLVFLDWAREATLSQRMVRYIKSDTGWRSALAVWVCRHLVEPWDQGHCKLEQSSR